MAKSNKTIKQEVGRRPRAPCSAINSATSGDWEAKTIKVGGHEVTLLDSPEVKPTVKGRDAPKQFRGNLVKTYRIFEAIRNKLSAEHVAAMQRTPFFNFWQPFLNGEVKMQHLSKSDIVLREMITKYSIRHEGFRFGKKILKLTTQDVDLIFGLKSGFRELGLENSSPKPVSDFAKRRSSLIKNDNMEVKEVKRELLVLVESRNEVDLVDFIKLLCVHSLYTVFDATSGIVVPSWIISIVDDLEGLNNIAWNKYIVDKLNSSLKKSHLVPENTIGCVLFLGYLMLEHSDLVRPVKPDGTPRFTKWKMLDLKQEHMELDEGILANKVDVASLEMTDAEIALYGLGRRITPCRLAISNPNIGCKKGQGSAEHNDKNSCVVQASDARPGSDQSTVVGAFLGTFEELRNEFIGMRNENDRLRIQIDELKERCDAAENKYYREVAIRREAEIRLEDSLVEAGVHSITQGITDEKTWSALKVELEAKDQIIADMRDQIKARDLDREFNSVSPNFSARRVDNFGDQSRGGSESRLHCSSVVQNISPNSVTMGATGSSSKHGSASGTPVEATNHEGHGYMLTGTPCVERIPAGKKRSAGSIERGVKLHPRPRQRNRKYEDFEPVVLSANDSSNERILANDKGAYEVGNYLTATDFSMLQLSYISDKKGLQEIVYKVPKKEHKVIRVEDLYDILTKDKVSNAFVECFNEMLLEYMTSGLFRRKIAVTKPGQPERIGPKILFMPANTWTYISGGWTGCLDDIHEMLNEHAKNPVDHIVVPLVSQGQGNNGLHWTLIVFSAKTRVWHFYNSIACGNLLDDLHRLDAIIVAKYIEAYMRHGYVNPQLTAMVDVNLKVGLCPKQDPGKPDCGVFMCYVLKQLVDGASVAVKLQPAQILNFRAKMIHWALNDGI